MSGFKGHIWGSLILSGFIIYLLYFLGNMFQFEIITKYIYSFEKMLTLVFLSVIFSLFPDIDTSSKGQKLFYFVFMLLDIYFVVKHKYRSAALLGLFAFLPILSKHRGWTHRKITAIIICSPFLILPIYLQSISYVEGVSYFFAAITGYFSHLIIDGEFFKI